jgi:hypothetical protein
MKKMYFLGLISMWGITLAGQITLHRQIVDEQKRPLVGVNIWRSQTGEGAVTDENGWFSFTFFPGIDILEITHLGYEPVSVQISTERSGGDIMITIPLYDNDSPDALLTKEIMPADIPESIMTPQSYYRSFFRIPVVLKQLHTLDSISFPSFLIAKVRIFPIPTSKTLYLNHETPLGQIDLYNLSGQKLQSFNFSDQLNATINLSIWPAGTYLLRSSEGWVEKVQKQ